MDRQGHIHQCLIDGLRAFFADLPGDPHACVALSGGLDSALVLTLAVEALGRERVRVLLLPSRYSSQASVADSQALLERLRLPKGQVYLISIEPLFAEALTGLDLVFRDACNAHSRSLAEENLQSRLRMLLTMGLCNAQNALMLNTSNRSERLVGYGTLYGDTSGAVGVIGGLYKTQVYELSHYLNDTGLTLLSGERIARPIPTAILTKAPSAELRADQKDTDSLPEYAVLDGILRALVDDDLSAEAIVTTLHYDCQTVERVQRLLASARFKQKLFPRALSF